MEDLDPYNIDVLKSSCGYIDNFIDGKTIVSLDYILNETQRNLLPDVDGNKSKLLKYTMLSVWYNYERKVPFVAAYNIDAKLDKIEVKRKTFRPDPRVNESFQLGEDFYNLITDFTEFEIGHMASHNEMSWGVNREIQAHQTFHYTNSVPQVERLNSGLWSKLESYLIKETKEAENQRIAVFTGPMLKQNDPTYKKDRGFQIPLFFYKIVVFSHKGIIYSTAFVMSQLERAIELGLIDEVEFIVEKAGLVPEPFSDYRHKDVFQVNISIIENFSGLNFHWDNVNRIEIAHGEHKLEEIAETGKIKSFESFKREERLTNMILP